MYLPFTLQPIVRHTPDGRQRTLVLADVVVNEFHLTPGFLPEPHVHDGPHGCVILAGGFEERLGRGFVPCEAGVARLSPAFDHHELRVGPAGLHCLVIEARPDAGIETGRRRAYLRDPALAQLAVGVLGAADDRSSCVLEIDMLAVELLVRMTRLGRPRGPARLPRWLREAHARLLATPAEPLRIGALAKELGVHRIHFAESFRRHFGMSPGEFLRRHRCLRARRMLLTTTRPIADVALETGFVDQSHLTRMLRRYLGVSPGVLRRVPSSTAPTPLHSFKHRSPGSE